MEVLSDYSTFIGILAIVLVVVLLFAFLASRYVTPKTDEAIIVSGSTSKEDKGLKVFTTHGGFVWPIFQKMVIVSLRSYQIGTECDAYSNNMIKVHLRVVANFKIGSTDDAIRKAAQRFAGQENQLNQFVRETIEGTMRAVVGQMTVEQLLTDRFTLSEKLRQEITDSLDVQGLQLDTLQIQDISDNSGYIDNLGAPQIAKARQDAAIANAQAQKNAQQADIDTKKAVALANKDLRLQQSAIDEETSRRQAEADAAKPIAEAEQNKKIAQAQQQVELANIEVTKAKLQSTVNATADAEKYRRTIEAQADAAAQAEKAKGIAAANQETARGNAEATRLTAEAEADATKAKAQAQADAIALQGKAEAEAAEAKGKAEAEAIKAKGLAEAEAMQKKADAYKQYGQAALQSLIIEKLPELADAVSKHLSNANITAVNADASDQVAGLTTDVAAKVPEFVKAFTGVDIASTLKTIASNGVTVNKSNPAGEPVGHLPKRPMPNGPLPPVK